MSWFDLTKILASKAAMRQDRALAMREANPEAFPCHPKDEPRWYRQK